MLADTVEAELLAAAEALLDELDEAEASSAVPDTGPQERCRTAALRKALRDVLRIAVSRGDRLPEPCDHGETRLCEGRTCSAPAAGRFICDPPPCPGPRTLGRTHSAVHLSPITGSDGYVACGVEPTKGERACRPPWSARPPP
ncbi:hypothetical protein HOK021_18530 [Streptomyces hygroscopicus]|nr:hypothetical protein HOK021_18530 [Streptomyces hygroscopicus]